MAKSGSGRAILLTMCGTPQHCKKRRKAVQHQITIAT